MGSRRIKVAILGPFPPATGGIATNIQNLLRSPLAREFILLKFRTMSTKYGTLEYLSERILAKLIRVFLDLSAYLFFLHRESPQIVHINTSFGIWSFWRDSMYLAISKIFQKKVLFQIHGGNLNEFWKHNSYGTKALIKQILKMPELIAVLSSVQRRPFEEIGFWKNVKVIPNTVDLYSYQDENSHRKEFDIPEDRVIVLFIASHFDKEKGIFELLNSIPLVTKENEKVLFVFVGGGKEEDTIVEFCQRKKLENYVKFPGYLANRDIARILNSSDIFVLPSYGEGFPLVILEAMAAGLPIISTPVGAIPEIIENGKNGFLVKSMDNIELAEKIRYLVENEKLRKKMGNNNIKKIQHKYDLTIVSGIFDRIYQQILY